MKKIIVSILTLCILCLPFALTAVAATEDKLIVKVFDDTDTNWLDNANGDSTSVEKIEGQTALLHVPTSSGISLKCKFSADWSKYDINNIVIKTNIYVDAPLTSDAVGTFKIKNGDSSDPDNSSENNQFNFELQSLELKKGWNKLELPLKNAVPDDGADFKIADWFCLWLNDNGADITVAISELEIVNRVEVAETTQPVTAEVTVAPDTTITTVAQDTVSDPTPVAETVPQTSDSVVIWIAIVSSVACIGFVANILHNKKRDTLDR